MRAPLEPSAVKPGGGLPFVRLGRRRVHRADTSGGGEGDQHEGLIPELVITTSYYRTSPSVKGPSEQLFRTVNNVIQTADVSSPSRGLQDSDDPQESTEAPYIADAAPVLSSSAASTATTTTTATTAPTASAPSDDVAVSAEFLRGLLSVQQDADAKQGLEFVRDDEEGERGDAGGGDGPGGLGSPVQLCASSSLEALPAAPGDTADAAFVQPAADADSDSCGVAGGLNVKERLALRAEAIRQRRAADGVRAESVRRVDESAAQDKPATTSAAIEASIANSEPAEAVCAVGGEGEGVREPRLYTPFAKRRGAREIERENDCVSADEGPRTQGPALLADSIGAKSSSAFLLFLFLTLPLPLPTPLYPPQPCCRRTPCGTGATCWTASWKWPLTRIATSPLLAAALRPRRP